jgi:hypothetical protein
MELEEATAIVAAKDKELKSDVEACRQALFAWLNNTQSLEVAHIAFLGIFLKYLQETVDIQVLI